MPTRRPAPYLPLLLIISANVLTILGSISSTMIGFGVYRTFPQLLSYALLSLPLPIALLAVCRRGSAAGIRNVQILAWILGGLQLLATLVNVIAWIILLTSGRYAQFLLILHYVPGSDTLCYLLSTFLRMRTMDFSYIPGLVWQMIIIAVEALYLVGTLGVLLSSRQAAAWFSPPDWRAQLDALYRQGAISEAEYRARLEALYYHP